VGAEANVRGLTRYTTVVRFDVPGSGASPDSPLPYRFPYLACVLGNLLKKVGVLAGDSGSSQVDVLGLSWGGALAQQFAVQNPRRCRRLILVSAGTGSVMIPGKPSVLTRPPPSPEQSPNIANVNALPGACARNVRRARRCRRNRR